MQTKRIHHVRTHRRDKPHVSNLTQLQSVVLKLKSRYLMKQCIK